jgi:hypothetical protein
MDRASAELAKIAPAKVANSDAKALARYLAALGADVTPDRLNDLLVLLAVLTIEAGGGLSLAIGMALSGPVRVASAPPADLPARSDPSATRPADVVGTRPLAGQRDPDSPTEVTGRF